MKAKILKSVKPRKELSPVKDVPENCMNQLQSRIVKFAAKVALNLRASF